jgi:hypothetical protein
LTVCCVVQALGVHPAAGDGHGGVREKAAWVQTPARPTAMAGPWQCHQYSGSLAGGKLRCHRLQPLAPSLTLVASWRSMVEEITLIIPDTPPRHTRPFGLLLFLFTSTPRSHTCRSPASQIDLGLRLPLHLRTILDRPTTRSPELS